MTISDTLKLTCTTEKAEEVVPLYPVENYTCIVTTNQPEEDGSVAERMKRLEEQYEETGMRRSVEAIIVFHERGVLSVLTLQVAADFFKLPGGYIDPSESEPKGLTRLLNETFGYGYLPGRDIPPQEWLVRQCVGTWWRYNYEGFLYPYLNAHVTQPKERKRIFLVTMGPRQLIGIPSNMKALAIPIHEFYDNTQRYGPQLSAVPHMLSRFTFIPQC